MKSSNSSLFKKNEERAPSQDSKSEKPMVNSTKIYQVTALEE